MLTFTCMILYGYAMTLHVYTRIINLQVCLCAITTKAAIDLIEDLSCPKNPWPRDSYGCGEEPPPIA